jgi:hypothetical protein
VHGRRRPKRSRPPSRSVGRPSTSIVGMTISRVPPKQKSPGRSTGSRQSRRAAPIDGMAASEGTGNRRGCGRPVARRQAGAAALSRGASRPTRRALRSILLKRRDR